MTRKKITLEYILHTSPSVLYPRLATPSGLCDWFADDVDLQDKLFTFKWGKDSEQKALLLSKRQNHHARYIWEEDHQANLDTYFEFKIDKDELTSELALIITDFVEEDEIEEQEELWTTQVEKLKHNLGI